MLIDSHAHVWRAAPNYPNPAATIVSPVSEVPVELLSEYMAEHGVARAVLVQPIYPGEDNSYIADCAVAQPERFAAMSVVDPRAPDATERLDYWVRERGCKGVRLRPRLAGEAELFGDRKTFPLWERARALDLVVGVLASPEHLPAVAILAERFPEVAILLNHMAHPDVAAGVHSPQFRNLLDLARYPRVLIQVTGYYYYSRQPYPYADCWEFFRAVYDRFGPARLVWGSDFPHVLLKCGYRRNLLLPERAYPYLSAADLELIMGGNAETLFWADETAPFEKITLTRTA